MIEDREVDKLKKKFTKLDSEQLDTLGQLLKRFKSSPRATMMEHLRLDQFSEEPDQELGPLASLQLSQLVNHGLGALLEFKGIKNHHIVQLTLIFDRLTEGISEVEISQDEMERVIEQRARYEEFMHGRNKNLKFLNSIEAESRISEAFSRLLEPGARSLQNQKLEEYWDTDLVREPFLEGLTFRELLTISIDALLKKRSFTNIKIHGLLRCVDSALETAALVPSSEEQESHIGAERQASDYAAKQKFPGWLAGEKLADQHYPTIRWFELEWENIQGSTSQLAQLIKLVPKIVSASEFCNLIKLIDQNDFSSKTSKDLIKEVHKRIKKLDLTLPSLQLWERLLCAPSVSEKELLAPFLDTASSHDSQRAVGRLWLVVLGAVRPIYGDYVLTGYWTGVPEKFETICEELANEPDSSKRAKKGATYLPFLESNELDTLLSRFE